MRIVAAHTLGDGARAQMAAIFAEGFYQWLRYFSKDKAKLARAFAHTFNLDVFWLAVEEDGTVLGMAACNDGSAPTVRLDKAAFKKHLGFLMGSFAYRMLKKEFEDKAYPFPTTQGMGTVEFVATEAQHRGRGVASRIIRQIFAATPYNEYVLEVADTNTPAVKAYQKLGFAEFMRVPLGRAEAKQSGINHYVYMKCVKPKGN